MGGVTALIDALSKGGKVEWTPPDRPRLRVPKGMGVAIQAEIREVQEVLRRAVLIREHLKTPGPSLFFVMPGAKIYGECCQTCGEGPPVARHEIRCQKCTAAARIALEGLNDP